MLAVPTRPTNVRYWMFGMNLTTLLACMSIKWSVDDPRACQGVVLSRAAIILRSIETHPLTGRFVHFDEQSSYWCCVLPDAIKLSSYQAIKHWHTYTLWHYMCVYMCVCVSMYVLSWCILVLLIVSETLPTLVYTTMVGIFALWAYLDVSSSDIRYHTIGYAGLLVAGSWMVEFWKILQVRMLAPSKHFFLHQVHNVSTIQLD